MLKPHKEILAAIIRDLRRDLLGTTEKVGTKVRGDLDRELERLGMLPDGRIQPIDALPNATPAEARAHEAAERFLETARRQGRSTAQARAEYIEQAAYSWINRLVALRALETRQLISDILRPSADYGGVSEAIYVLAQTNPSRVAVPDGGWWEVLDQACAAQAMALPGLFGTGDPVLTLRPSVAALRRCVERIGRGPTSATPETTDIAFADPDAIGWAYQFYQEEAKATAFASFKDGKKATSRATIAAATQLFTEPYMVKWLLQNSLGRSYHEIYPDSELPKAWEYYIHPSEDRPLGQPAPTVSSLKMLTILDPCVGSGHFLREAFDLLAAMYRERHPDWDAHQIVETILRHHLHGIDIDPRAVQLAALTLYMRALELLRDEARARRQPMPHWTPTQINLATTPSGLDGTALERRMARHPEDRPLHSLLERIFESLGQAELLGSLLRPGAEIDAAIAKLQSPRQTSLFDTPDPDAGDITRRDPAALKQLVLEQVAKSFHEEAISPDPADALFGREAERGVRLRQILDRKYAVVVTNPPYMGGKNMPDLLKKYVESHYKTGKRDLYAAFILRCLDLCLTSGRIAMVTQQSWMFLRSFAELRAMPTDHLADTGKKRGFTGILRETSIEGLAHLGPNAFEEISGEVVQSVLFTFLKVKPHAEHRLTTFRLIGLKSAAEKASLLRNPAPGIVSTPRQHDILAIPEAPLVYWLGEHLLQIITSQSNLGNARRVVKGISTSWESKFIRFEWEVLQGRQRWFGYAKGGGYRKWCGVEWYAFDWQDNGSRLKAFNSELFGGAHWSKSLRNIDILGQSGLICSRVARGSLGFRLTTTEFGFDSTAIFVSTHDQEDAIRLLVDLNSRVATFILRSTMPAMVLESGYVGSVPLLPEDWERFLYQNVQTCILLKQHIVATNPTERSFTGIVEKSDVEAFATLLHTLEGINEEEVFAAYRVAGADMQAVLEETGTPAGFYPLVDGYDMLPEMPAELEIQALPNEVLAYLERHERITPSPEDLARLKNRLRTLYEAGSGAKEDTADDQAINDIEDTDEGVDPVAGAHIPIPCETFLENLAVRMELHPISIYWLLNDLRVEGTQCKPEDRRLLEDRLSVLVLRLLGHRWPKQIAAYEPLPDWADADGIIPLVHLGIDESTLADRIRVRLRAEDGETGAQCTEQLLAELTGATSLEDWCVRLFWPRHVKQFKSRPIAWHLASRPLGTGKKRSTRQPPLFACMLYYHALGGDALVRLRTQYVEPLLRREESALAEALGKYNSDTATLANARVEELRDFLSRLQHIEREGFACHDLDALLGQEILDRWSCDGIAAPANAEELARQEQAWRVDLNDGVRVNIAPLQLAGVLAGNVLKATDANKAIADRAHWRADERRWVRMGKLPRCGWMDESVPESLAWTRLASERTTEQHRLKEKRRATSGGTT